MITPRIHKDRRVGGVTLFNLQVEFRTPVALTQKPSFGNETDGVSLEHATMPFPAGCIGSHNTEELLRHRLEI